MAMLDPLQYLRIVRDVADAGGAVAIVAGAFALGLRHGIDWDHIAAITDITSSTASAPTNAIEAREEVLTRELGLQLTDEDHHQLAHADGRLGHMHERSVPVAGGRAGLAVARFVQRQRAPFLLGMLYALGHATVVILLGLLAILAAGFLPDWIDPIMGRIVGVTLIFLAVYLYVSIFQFFRGGEFRIRSRWMLIFAGVRSGYRWFQARRHGHVPHDVPAAEQYGARTAFGIGLIHGVGAETGTQVLVIATAVGAGSRAAGVAALFSFVLGLLLSNALVTLATSAGFVGAQKRQWLYVAAGLLAATFSLVLGVLFVTAQDGVLPSLDAYLQWIGLPR